MATQSTTIVLPGANEARDTQQRKRPRDALRQDREPDELPGQKTAGLKRRRQTRKTPSVVDTTSREQHERQTMPSLITARMPLNALTSTWSLGQNRPLIPHHVQVLKQRFLDEGGPKREAKGNYLQVLCSGTDVRRMMKSVGVSETNSQAAGAIPNFEEWMRINGERKVEVLAGQHRIQALVEFATHVGLGEDDLWWPCEIYDRDTLPHEQNLQLRVNRRQIAKADSHGDIWLQAVAAESQNPQVFGGSSEEMMEKMAKTLYLYNERGVPLRRLVTLWRNERWKTMITQWCKTNIGRATFRISTWEWMVSCRIDDFWFSFFRHTLKTLAELPGDANRYVGPDDWKRMSQCLHPGRSEAEIHAVFYVGDAGSTRDGHTSRRVPSFLESLDDDSHRHVYEHIVEHDEIRFPDVHGLTGLSEDDGKILPRVMDHVVDWLSKDMPGGGRSERPSRINRRNNNKPPMREALKPALGRFSQTLLQHAGHRANFLFTADISGRPVSEMASIMMQQEILEFVYDRLAAFRRPCSKVELGQRLTKTNEEQYRQRFLGAEWAGVLGIVRWYMETNFRPTWVTSEQPRQQGGNEATGLGLGSALLNFAKMRLDSIDYDALQQDVCNLEFEEKLGHWLKNQYGRKDQGAKGEESPLLALSDERAQGEKHKSPAVPLAHKTASTRQIDG